MAIVNKISKEANCQVIATTHSYEMISALKENAVDTNDFAYYRLGRGTTGIKSFRYDYTMLDSAFRAEMEVR